METLKLTTLAMLIPVGLLVSDAAAAYPGPGARTEAADKHSQQRVCGRYPKRGSEAREPCDTSRPFEAFNQPFQTPAHRQRPTSDCNGKFGICWLNLDRIEVD